MASSDIAHILQNAKLHRPKLLTIEYVKKVVHGGNFFGRLNNKIATIITDSVGTMWCAYAFEILALVSLPDAIKTGNPVVIVAWIAQTFLQLVLLPVIIVGQNIQAKHSDLRAQVDHENLCSVHEIAKQNNEYGHQTRHMVEGNKTGERLKSIEQKLEAIYERMG